MGFIRELVYRLRGEYTTEKLVSMGLVVGNNFKRMSGTILDPSHCWLIEIGDNVTLSQRVHILCHDASTKAFIDYTKIGRVRIGNRVFVGSDTVVLPGVTIGDNVVIGSNSTVTSDIPADSVAVGSPARVICSLKEYIAKEKKRMSEAPVFDESFTLNKSVSKEKKQEQKKALENTIGFIE